MKLLVYVFFPVILFSQTKVDYSQVKNGPPPPAMQIPLRSTGTTYYVSSTLGADSNAGTFYAPWKTVAKVNSAALVPGDTVLFYKSDYWSETLTVPASGNSSAPITFSWYGPPNYIGPLFDAADRVIWWTVQSGAAYKAAYTSTAAKVFVDSIYSESAPLTLVGSISAVVSTAGSFFSDGTNVYVHLLDGSSPSAHIMSVSGARTNGILMSGKNYITLDGLVVVRCKASCILGEQINPNDGANPKTNEYIIVKNSTVFNWGSAGVVSNFPYMDVGIGGHGFSVPSGVDNQSALRGWQVSNNVVGRSDAPAVTNYHEAGIELDGMTGSVVTGNYVKTTNSMGIANREYYQKVCGTANQITNNELTANQGNIQNSGCPSMIIMSNNIHDSQGYGIGIGSITGVTNNSLATAAQISKNTMARLNISADSALFNGFDCNSGATGGSFTGNNVLNVYYGESFTLEATGGACSGWTFSGNTFDQTGNASVTTSIAFIRDTSTSGFVFTSDNVMVANAATTTPIDWNTPDPNNSNATYFISIPAFKKAAASTQGNGTKTQMSTGSTTTNDCVKFDANGNTVDAGAACGSGAGSLGVQVDTGTIYTEPNLRFVTGNGVTPTAGDSPGVRSTIQLDIDGNVALLNAAYQAGTRGLVTTTSASGTTYTGTMAPALTAYTKDQVLIWDVGATACTAGAVTINISTLGAKSVKEADGSTNPVAGDCPANRILGIAYDGTVFRIISGGVSATGGTVNSVTATAPLASSGGTAPVISIGTAQGNGSKVQLSTGTTTTNNCVKFDANGNTVDAGATCSGGLTTGRGQINFPMTYSTLNTVSGAWSYNANVQAFLSDGFTNIALWALGFQNAGTPTTYQNFTWPSNFDNTQAATVKFSGGQATVATANVKFDFYIACVADQTAIGGTPGITPVESTGGVALTFNKTNDYSVSVPSADLIAAGCAANGLAVIKMVRDNSTGSNTATTINVYRVALQYGITY